MLTLSDIGIAILITGGIQLVCAAIFGNDYFDVI